MVTDVFSLIGKLHTPIGSWFLNPQLRYPLYFMEKKEVPFELEHVDLGASQI